MNKIIVGMGEALWDVLPEGKKIGGAPANFAYHVSQFGFDSRVVSAVGRDADGQEILDVFAQKKLTCEIDPIAIISIRWSVLIHIALKIKSNIIISFIEYYYMFIISGASFALIAE